MKELLAVEDVNKVVVVGHDWGGYIAWKFANYHSDLIQCLIVLCTPYTSPAEAPFGELKEYTKRNPNFSYMVL